MEDKNIGMARRIAAAVREAGGRTYYVGGCVRDRLLGREIKDIDIEVHGIPVPTLEAVLDRLGERLTKGESFGVMGLRHYDLDIAMPRSEKATGRGHRDFEVFVDPFLGEEKAARRRDFTMNALMQDVLTGEVLDFFGGQADMARGRIRHVDDRTFAEDPLRVFRAAQFAARFGYVVAPETTALCASMAVDALPGERVMGELEKALRKADRPSVFFETLRRMDQLSVWFPELAERIGLSQPAGGDAWGCTMRVLDEAAKRRGEVSEPLWFLLAALCCDPDGTAEADGGAAGLPRVRTFLGRLTREGRLTRYVQNLTALCAEPDRLVRRGADPSVYMALFDRCVCPADLLLLAQAVRVGRPGTDPEAAAETERTLRGMLAVYTERMSRPYVQGRDLVEVGLTPGPRFGEALDCAHRLRLAGAPKDEQLRAALALIRQAGREAGPDQKDET